MLVSVVLKLPRSCMLVEPMILFPSSRVSMTEDRWSAAKVGGAGVVVVVGNACPALDDGVGAFEEDGCVEFDEQPASVTAAAAATAAKRTPVLRSPAVVFVSALLPN